MGFVLFRCFRAMRISRAPVGQFERLREIGGPKKGTPPARGRWGLRMGVELRPRYAVNNEDDPGWAISRPLCVYDVTQAENNRSWRRRHFRG